MRTSARRAGGASRRLATRSTPPWQLRTLFSLRNQAGPRQSLDGCATFPASGQLMARCRSDFRAALVVVAAVVVTCWSEQGYWTRWWCALPRRRRPWDALRSLITRSEFVAAKHGSRAAGGAPAAGNSSQRRCRIGQKARGCRTQAAAAATAAEEGARQRRRGAKGLAGASLHCRLPRHAHAQPHCHALVCCGAGPPAPFGLLGRGSGRPLLPQRAVAEAEPSQGP